VRKRAPSTEQLGSRVAYLALKDGTPVYDRDGNRVGVVEHVMAERGIFEGVLVHTYPLPGRHLYADATQIAELHENGVLLSVQDQELHDPRAESPRRRRNAPEGGLEARLRHAFDWLTAHLPGQQP
jgi:hypothetical protein